MGRPRALRAPGGGAPRRLPGGDVGDTGGTGSGKTECFLLPALAALVRESGAWRRPASPAAVVDTGDPFTPARRGRPPAGRARAGAVPDERAGRRPAGADAPGAGLRPRHRLAGPPPRRAAVLLRPLHRADAVAAATTCSASTSAPTTSSRRPGPRLASPPRSREARTGVRQPRHRPHVARPLGAEMLCREEMTFRAPDVLITNYSMLNVMLMRAAKRRSSSRPPPGWPAIPAAGCTSSSTSCTPTAAPRAPKSRCCCDGSATVSGPATSSCA